MMNTGHRNGLLWSLMVLLTAGPLLAAEPTTQPEPGRIRLTVSRKTTHILGPINKDGTVNYLAYLNAKYSKGVTKANNAAIPLIEILGTDFAPKDARGKICKMLKIELPAKGKNTFSSVRNYIEKTLSDKDADAWEDRDDLEKAKTGPWNAKQYPVIAGWLEINNDALNATLAAIKRTDYYMPGVSDSPDEQLLTLTGPGGYAYRDLSDALVARAMLKLDSGDVTGAWADLTATRHLARRIGRGYMLVECLIAMATERAACSADRSMAGSGKLTGAQARAFLVDMQRLSPLPDPVDTIDEYERFFTLDTVMFLACEAKRKGLVDLNEAIKIASGGAYGKLSIVPPHMKSLEWDEVLITVNSWYDRFLNAARRKPFKARAEALAVFDKALGKHKVKVHVGMFDPYPPFLFMRFGDPAAQKKTEMMARRLVSRATGGFLISALIPYGKRVVELRDRATAEGELSVVAMALAAYRAEKKVYPDKLSQLSPGYLKKVPDDLFVDKPFGYKRTGKGYLLYSVGENMKYDGPKKNEDEVKDDIVVRLE